MHYTVFVCCTVCDHPGRGLVYTHCVPKCGNCHVVEPDCYEASVQYIPESECEAGCACPPGMLYDGRKCVMADDCPCLLEIEGQSKKIIEVGQV